MNLKNESLAIGKLINRVIFYIIGLLILAFGVVFSINSELGVSPVNSLPYVISIITGRDMGISVIMIFSFYILVQILILKREFKLINLTQLIFSTVFGYFVDFAKFIMGSFAIPTYMGQLSMLAISIFLVALGISLYVNANLIYMPMEGMTMAIQKKVLKKLSFQDVKTILDCLVVGIGIVLSLVFLGGIVGIREGTIISAILVGRTMRVLQDPIIKVMEKLCL